MRGWPQYVDAVTGEPVGPYDAGAVFSHVAVPYSVAGSPTTTWVPVPPDKVGRRFFDFALKEGFDYDDVKREGEAIRAAERKAKKDRRNRPTQKQELPGITETYRNAGQAADLFMGENYAFIETIGYSGAEDIVRDFLDGFEVIRGRPRKDGTYSYTKLAKTKKGREIIDAFESSDESGAREFLVWLFSRNRGKRWEDVNWAAVESLGELLAETCEEYKESLRGSERGTLQCTGWVWYPPAANLRPLSEILEDLSPKAAQQIENAHYKKKLGELVASLRAAFKKGRDCMPPQTRKTVERRIAYLSKLAKESWRIPGATICGEDTKTGDQFCGFPAIRAEVAQLKRACEFGYDPNWPMAEALSEESADAFGLPVAVATGEARPLDIDGEAVTLEELDEIPWASTDNPRKWSLVSAVAMAKKHPRTFKRPSAKKLAAIAPGDFVKAAFKASKGDKATERMWVIVTERDGDTLRGKLDNRPAFRGSGLRLGSRVELRLRDVYDVKKTNPDAQATPRKGGSKRKRTSSKAKPIRSRPNGASPWGELLDLRARVMELEIETPRGVEVHTWHRDRPALFWSEKRRALVWVHGGKDPAQWIDAAAKGPIASRHRAWHGDEPAERGEVQIPAGRLVKLGPALRIVYSAERYRDGVPRHHDFGADVAAYSQKGRGARVFSVRGGRLTLNDRGLVF